VAIQANGSNNLIRNMNTGVFQIIPSRTIADSISVDIPRNFYMARDYLQKYKGETLSIADDEIINASSSLSRNTGLFAEPAAASAFAGYLHYVQNHKIEDNTDNLVLLTGSGLKDIKSLANYIKMPASIHPEIEELDKFLNN
jgi:threonine synthase